MDDEEETCQPGEEGCPKQYKEEQRTEDRKMAGSDRHPLGGLGIGGIILLFAIVGAILCFLYWYSRRDRQNEQRQSPSNTTPKESSGTEPTSNEEEDSGDQGAPRPRITLNPGAENVAYRASDEQDGGQDDDGRTSE